jgi:hypothetical protein
MAAQESETYSKLESPELREMYEKLAAQWRALAVEIERTSKW